MFAGCNADQTPSDCAKVLCASLEQIALPVPVRFVPANQAPDALPVLSFSLNVKLILIVGTQSWPLTQQSLLTDHFLQRLERKRSVDLEVALPVLAEPSEDRTHKAGIASAMTAEFVSAGSANQNAFRRT